MSRPDPILDALDAVDAALAGRPVDPVHAELAELALLLSAGAPRPSAEAAERLDTRFTALAPPPFARQPRRRLRPAYWAGLLAVPLVLALLVLVLPGGGGGGTRSGAYNGPSFASSGSTGSASSAAKSPAGTRGHAPSASSAESLTIPSASSAPGNLGSTSQSGDLFTPAPVPNGRRIVQSDQLTLAAPSGQIGVVAEELFQTVGSEGGIVEHSQVSAGAGAYASFTLSIPTANLSATLARLSGLRGARVIGSNASANDVNSQYLDDARALRDAQALRRTLLGQLRAASTTLTTDALTAKVRAVEATIARDEATLNHLTSQVDQTTVTVQIQPAGASPAPVRRFGISRAVHDAVDVLSVLAAVAIVALAVLIPLGLLLAVGLWIAAGRRRRSRERALDGA